MFPKLKVFLKGSNFELPKAYTVPSNVVPALEGLSRNDFSIDPRQRSNVEIRPVQSAAIFVYLCLKINVLLVTTYEFTRNFASLVTSCLGPDVALEPYRSNANGHWLGVDYIIDKLCNRKL